MRNIKKITNSIMAATLWSFSCLAVLANLGSEVYATELAGSITQLSGGLMVKKSDGTPKIQGLASTIEVGDTVITPKSTFARIALLDKSEITLKSGTTLVIKSVNFDPTALNSNAAVVRLEKGGINVRPAPENGQKKMAILLQTNFGDLNITGANAFIAVTEASEKKLALLRATLWASSASLDLGRSTSDVGPRRSGIVALPMLAQNAPSFGVGLAPGLYVHVIDGLIQLSNRGGVQQFAAGQFGFTASIVQPPVIVPKNPGIQFNPPPAFSSSTGPAASSSNSKPNTVDCEVR